MVVLSQTSANRIASRLLAIRQILRGGARSPGVSMSRITPGSPTGILTSLASCAASSVFAPSSPASATSSFQKRATMPTGWPRRARKYGAASGAPRGERVAHRGDRARAARTACRRARPGSRRLRPRRAPRRRGSRPCPRRRCRTPRPRSLRFQRFRTARRSGLHDGDDPREISQLQVPRGLHRDRQRRAAARGAACRNRSGVAEPAASSRPTMFKACFTSHAEGSKRCAGFAAQEGSFTPWRTAVISARIATAISGGVLEPMYRPTGPRRRAISSGRDVELLQPLAARVVVLLRADGADVERGGLQPFHQREVVELRIVRERDQRAVAVEVAARAPRRRACRGRAARRRGPSRRRIPRADRSPPRGSRACAPSRRGSA